MRSLLGRITLPTEYADILKKATRVSYRGVVLAVAPSASTARLGFAVSRDAGNAVQRNRFRRVVREFLRQQSLPKVDMVIMMRAAISQLSNEELRLTMAELIKKKGWGS